MQWSDLSFKQLSLDELYDVLKLRIDVFIVEQNCPYPELDDKDRHPETRHLIGRDPQGEIVAYARVLAPGVSYPDSSIGRVLVAEKARGGGNAKFLMDQAIGLANEYWPNNNIQLGGQEYLKSFYQKLGFKPVSEVYLEDGIPHLDMLYQRT
ncbi:GNAT family N-acetyltransferase [Shewanella sp. D64]|uniref:GNAT family N-acetyltransferase n=1 Tax=unclassified Shewanella TaxID=196818 RepID=UPI0022BA68A2|nr:MULTISPECIES: GNAT family N-acetyltransferase [unclassified Shewanella]MEC4727986.1 GNAT family N-acetyltransferase [Shewanella sp. D64]MEC4740169.1 GNAT family N-acetyltransferase [Shewanella sp. E94]WBJ95227.1 GNAT family N-acetyltransferase [Shewanella sp. MTB7]